ncbi:MAG: hypothetical protein D6790_00835 [Caldilineae bacterium]|nr:MAG: hypothetical protein D6790_00835 [Caldilineae bacterium]
MPLENIKSTTWLRLSEGSFWLPSHDRDPEAKPFNKKDGSIVYYRPFNALSGYVDSVFTRTNNFDEEEVVVVVDDGENRYGFSVRLRSSMAKQIVAQLMCADPAKEVRFIARHKKFESGFEGTSLLVTQDGQPLNWWFASSRSARAKDMPTERILPPAEEKIINGKRTLDFSNQIFYLKGLVEKLGERFKGAIEETTSQDKDDYDSPLDDEWDIMPADTNEAPADKAESPSAPADDLDDDLPF